MKENEALEKVKSLLINDFSQKGYMVIWDYFNSYQVYHNDNFVFDGKINEVLNYFQELNMENKNG